MNTNNNETIGNVTGETSPVVQDVSPIQPETPMTPVNESVSRPESQTPVENSDPVPVVQEIPVLPVVEEPTVQIPITIDIVSPAPILDNPDVSVPVSETSENGSAVPVSTPEPRQKRKYTRRNGNSTRKSTKVKSVRHGQMGRPKTMVHLKRVVLIDGKPAGRGAPPSGAKLEVVFIPRDESFSPKKFGHLVKKFRPTQHRTYDSMPIEKWTKMLSV